MLRIALIIVIAVLVICIVLLVSEMIGIRTDEEAEKNFKKSLEEYEEIKRKNEYIDAKNKNVEQMNEMLGLGK